MKAVDPAGWPGASGQSVGGRRDNTGWRRRHPPTGEDLWTELDRAIANAPPEGIPALVAALSARISTMAAMAMLQVGTGTAEAQPPDQNLTVEEAARRLGMSKDYLYRNARRLPFSRRIGRRLLFSSRGLDNWMARR